MPANASLTTTIEVQGPEQITGIILAGGAGQRMGGEDKGWLSFHNKALIEHVITRFAPQVHRIIISCNRNIERYQQLGHQIVRDADATYQGPLAGIYAGLQLVSTEWAAVVPVDAPFLPEGLTQKLLACAITSRSNASCVLNGESIEPTFCLISRSVLTDLGEYLQQDKKRSVQGFLKTIRCAYCQFNDALAFKNLNRPEDLM